MKFKYIIAVGLISALSLVGCSANNAATNVRRAGTNVGRGTANVGNNIANDVNRAFDGNLTDGNRRLNNSAYYGTGTYGADNMIGNGVTGYNYTSGTLNNTLGTTQGTTIRNNANTVVPSKNTTAKENTTRENTTVTTTGAVKTR